MQGSADLAPSRPVMTFRAGGDWLAVPIEQMEKVASAQRLWPVPMARDQHIGLLSDGGAMVPVMSIDLTPKPATEEHLVAVLVVRGEPVGLSIERAGHLHESYWMDEDSTEDPPAIALSTGGRLARSSDSHFWLIDADNLWPHSGRA